MERFKFLDERDALLYLLVRGLAGTHTIEELVTFLDTELPEGLTAMDVELVSGMRVIRTLFTLKYRDIFDVADNMLGIMAYGSENEEEEERELFNRIPSRNPTARQDDLYDPYKYLTFEDFSESNIYLLNILGFSPLSSNAMVHVLNIDSLSVDQWDTLIALRFPFCIPSGMCVRETQSVYYPLADESLVCDPLSKMLVNLSAEGNVRLLAVDRLIPLLLSTTCLDPSVKLGVKVDSILAGITYKKKTFMYIVTERSVYSLPEHLDKEIEILTRIRDVVDEIRNRKTYRGVMGELSMTPLYGRFPGGPEYREARERLYTSGFTTLTQQDIDSIVKYATSPLSPSETLTDRDNKVWNDIISLLTKAGILPWETTSNVGNKENALTLIAQRIQEILREVQTGTLEQIQAIGAKFNIQIPSQQVSNQPLSQQIPSQYNIEQDRVAVRDAIIAWSNRITLDTDWRTIIQVMNSLGLTNLPDSIEGIVRYLKEYITQY